MAARKQRPIGTAQTTRLRRVACERDCGYVARVSRKVLLLGVPTCPCGGRVLPSALEDAELLAEHGLLTAEELAEHPEAIAYLEQLERVDRGRGGSQLRRSAFGTDAARTRDGKLAAGELAMRRVQEQRRAWAIANQLAALKTSPVPADDTATNEIPF